MADRWIEPTAEQNEQALLVQGDIVALVNRLLKEGNDARIVMAGMGAATADLITCTFGPTAVAPWFQKQADMVRELQRPFS